MTSPTNPLTADIDRLVRQPRTLVNREYWFPLALFGGLSLVAAAIYNQWDPATTTSWIFWAIAGPLGGVATALWFWSRSTNLGVRPTHIAVYPIIGIATSIGCALVGSSASSDWATAGVIMVVGLGNVAFAFVDRHALMMVVGGGLVAIGFLAGIGDLSASALSLVSGGFMLTAAAAQKFAA